MLLFTTYMVVADADLLFGFHDTGLGDLGPDIGRAEGSPIQNATH